MPTPTIKEKKPEKKSLLQTYLAWRAERAQIASPQNQSLVMKALSGLAEKPGNVRSTISRPLRKR